ncbi:MAG: hypothetical protein ACYTEM_08200, partial [Planctomycetota bacterium]
RGRRLERLCRGGVIGLCAGLCVFLGRVSDGVDGNDADHDQQQCSGQQQHPHHEKTALEDD